LLVSCRKPVVAPVSDLPAAVTKNTGTVRVESPVAPDSAGTGENQRTRALPRPEDRKYAAPAVPEEEPVQTAVQVEGSPGFVTSPFNGKIVDVRDIPPGTLVADPTFPSEEKKYFRTP
jgi:hypothetical protein